MQLRNVKGTRDLLPEQKIQRNKLIATLQEIFELYGYNPIETPALEMLNVLADKFAGGEEILKEIFTLKDNADRELGLRYDLTVPFARVVATNPQLKKPFKRYQIDRVWRNGPIKLGRYREFWQCDVDVAGIKSVAAEAELLSLMQTFFARIGLDVYITVNNRKILTAIMQYADIGDDKWETAILSLDKLAKVGKQGVITELAEKQINADSAEKMLQACGCDTIESLKELIGDSEGTQELTELFTYTKNLGVTIAKPQFSLARGLAYYTGTIWEVYLTSKKITSSLGAGGRFDNMVGKFMGNQNVPAVGCSFGLDVILDALKLEGVIAEQKSVTQLYIVPIKTLEQSLSIATQLRENGIRTDIDLNGRPMSKNLDFADKFGIPFALIIGESEIESGKFTLKNMKTGEQIQESLKKIQEIIHKAL